MLSFIKKNNFIFLIFLISCSDFKRVYTKNVLIILADDLGYSDISFFGSEINTPNIDYIAENGNVFTNYYSSPLCAPSRAMLLSGNDNHIAGIGIQAYNSDFFGYEGVLSSRVKIIPEVLKDKGYKTFMSGKWHLGSDPYFRGFDNTFTLLPGAFTHYDNNKPILGYPDSAFSVNGNKILWEEGKYSSDVYTDRIIDFMSSSDDTPFFGYLSFTAPHWPLQVDTNFSNLYKGVYDKGYEHIKNLRIQNLINKNIIENDSDYINKNFLSKWESLSDFEKKVESKKMEIYAGMIANLDFNIGRIISYLRETNKLENTVIVFMSDNGAAGEDFYFNSTYGDYIKDKFSYDYEIMGLPESFISLGKNWADVITNPFKNYKGFTNSGGMRSPFLIYGLENKSITISDEFITVLDVAPTIYDIVDIDNSFSIGESFIPYLRQEKDFVHDDDYVFSFEHSGNSVLVKGEWKLVNNSVPFDKNKFQLYSLSDISERKNLSEENNDVYRLMLDEWDKFYRSKKIILPTPYKDNLN